MNPTEPCPRIEAISASIDGELGEPDRLALDRHVAGCAICAPVLAEFSRLRNTFSGLPAAAPGVDIAALVDRRLAATTVARRPKSPPRPRRLRWWQVAPAALGGALALSLGAYLGSALMLGSQPAAQPAALQMAAFAVSPPGALCPALQVCKQ